MVKLVNTVILILTTSVKKAYKLHVKNKKSFSVTQT